MPYAHHARGSNYKRRQFWTSYYAAGMTLTQFVAPGDIIPVETSRTNASGGWTYNTGTYGGSEVVVPMEGQYMVGFKLTSARGSLGASAIGQIVGAIYVNGTLLAASELNCGTVRASMLAEQSAGVSFAHYFLQGDQVQVKAYCKYPSSGSNYCGVAPNGVSLSLTMLDAI